MSELTRLMKETNEALIRCGATVESGAALTAERAEWLRVEKSLRAQLAAQHDETREARAEVDRLRALLRVARGPLAIGASYAGAPGLPLGQRLHADDCYAALQRITAALETP